MPRLTRAKWVEAGLEALRKEGPGGLAAEPMARRFGVSRGSFYWHFKSALDFQAAVLGEWEQHWTSRIIANVQQGEASPQDRLLALIQKTGGEDASLYASAKRMARINPELEELLVRVDQRRLNFVASLLVEGGVPNGVADLRAQIVYAWAMGQMLISGEQKSVPRDVAECLAQFAFQDVTA